MSFSIDGRTYEILFGSDIINDGVFIELNDLQQQDPNQVLFAFRSDIDNRITIHIYQKKIPYELMERFLEEVEKQLIINKE